MKRLSVILLVLCLMVSAMHAQIGIVRSTGYGAVKKERPVLKLPDAMIGITGGIGMTVSQAIVYPNGALAFDFAISITPKVALGAFTQWGILENFSMGVLLVAGDYMNNKTSFVFGLGGAVNARAYNKANWRNTYDGYGYETKYSRGGVPIERFVRFYDSSVGGVAMRLGFITPKHFYMTFDCGIFPHMYRSVSDRYMPKNGTPYGTEVVDLTASTITLSFGYAFGIRPKSKTAKQEAAL